MNKFLHEPSVRLRAAAANGRGLGVVDAARYLFALDERRLDDPSSDAADDADPRGGRADADSRDHGRRRLHRLASSPSASCARAGTVHVIDNLVTGKRENLAAGRDASTSSTSATRGGGAASPSLQARRARASRGADGRAPERRRSGVRRERRTSLGSLNLLEAVRKHSPKTRVVFASTGGALYGDNTTPPNVEDFKKDPESPYAISKLTVEYYLAYYGRVHGLDTVATALRQRVRAAAGSARRGRRGRDLLRPHPRRQRADDLRRRLADARLRVRRRRGGRDLVARRRSRCRRSDCSTRAASTSARGSAPPCIDLAKTLIEAAGHVGADRLRAEAAGRAAGLVRRRRQGRATRSAGGRA